MNEQEIVELAVDIAIKHGKHNQKSHGNRGAAGQAYLAEYRAARAAGGSVAVARAQAKKESAMARSAAGEQRLKAESAAAYAARKPAADTLKRAQKELPADKAKEAERIIQEPLSQYDRANDRVGMIKYTLQKGTMLGRPLDPPTRRNIQRDLRETIKRRDAALQELNSARDQVEQMLVGS